MRLWYYELLEFMTAALRNPVQRKQFVCTPQRKRTTCSKRIYDKIALAEWFHNAFRSSLCQTSDVGHLIHGRLFVTLADFDDKSTTNKLRKVLIGHPFLMTFLSLTLEGRKCSNSSCFLVSLLPDVSDVQNKEDSKSNSRYNN